MFFYLVAKIIGCRGTRLHGRQLRRWTVLMRANVDVREVKPIVEPNAEIVLGQLFQLKAVTIHTVSEVYLQMRRYLNSLFTIRNEQHLVLKSDTIIHG